MDHEVFQENQKSNGQSLSSGDSTAFRTPSSLRMTYSADVRVFRAQHGGLEEIRLRLGFSRRKMCQLLMVDPSAWTRWTRDETKAPPHIYRALEWFLALNQKALTQPELAAAFHARHKITPKIANTTPDPAATRAISLLEGQMRHQRHLIWGLSIALGSTLLALAGQLFIR